MSPARLLPCFACAIAVSACTPQRHDGGVAVVSEQGGAPCFAIANTEASRSGAARLERVQVVDELGRDLWLAHFTGATPLMPGRCVPYGDATGSTAVAAQALQPGKVYRVAVTAPMAARPNETMNYSADFCVLGDAGKVHQIEWDAQAARWRREACSAAAP